MEHKSLRQLARELGVSHSYLSQVRHGKRPASEKVVSKMVSSGKQNSFDTPTANSYKKWQRTDLNRRPKAYESSALPLSYAASRRNIA